MKLSLLALCALVAADDLSAGIPSCATKCVTDYTVGNKIAGCKQLDIACICKNSDFLSGIACCLDKACDDDGKKAAVAYAKKICGAEGVDTPDQVVCKANAGTTTAAAAAETSTAAAVGVEGVGGLAGALIAAMVAL